MFDLQKKKVDGFIYKIVICIQINWKYYNKKFKNKNQKISRFL